MSEGRLTRSSSIGGCCGYVWAPPHYEQFVDRCAAEIRRQLGRPDMSRDEMLSALAGMPFEQFRDLCRQSLREGRIPPFE